MSVDGMKGQGRALSFCFFLLQLQILLFNVKNKKQKKMHTLIFLNHFSFSSYQTKVSKITWKHNLLIRLKCNYIIMSLYFLILQFHFFIIVHKCHYLQIQIIIIIIYAISNWFSSIDKAVKKTKTKQNSKHQCWQLTWNTLSVIWSQF